MSKFSVLLAALGTLIISAPANATVITFDDVKTGEYQLIENGYAGFNWKNLGFLNAQDYTINPSGYTNGLVSSPNVAFSWYSWDTEFSSPAPFTLNSVNLIAAWNDGLNVKVTGWLGSEQKYEETFVVDSLRSTLETFNWANIDKVTMVASGGETHGWGGSGEHFAIDNLRVNEVPLPAALPLFGTGLFALAAKARKRRTV